MSVRPVRRALLWTVPAVAAACVATVATVVSAVPAQARPANPPKPPKPLTQTTLSRAQHALVRNGSTDLIVSLNRGGSLSGVSAAARNAHMTVRGTFKAVRMVTVRVPAGQVNSARAILQAQPGVHSVDVNVARYPMDVPNDPLYASTQSSYLDAVNAPAAWGHTHGSSSVDIAILDSGIDTSHEDLASKIDSAVKVDSTSAGDSLGHGTFVAGVAAAATNNGKGIAGTGWDTHLDAIKVADDQEQFSLADEIAGINDAIGDSPRPKVMNISLGGPDYTDVEAQAIAAAQAAGIVVVAAAGNDALHGDPVEYPAGYPGVIAVGAVDPTFEQRADFSEYGSWVTVAAPGVGIEGTIPTNNSVLFGTPSSPSTAYANGDGTSFASPIVAGEVALLASLRPSATVAQLRAAVVNSAHPLPGQGLGAGLVDFAAAIDHLPPTSTPTITAPAASPVSGAVTLTATSTVPSGRIQFAVDGHNVGGQVAVDGGGSASTTWTSYGQADGSHTVTAFDCTPTGECSTTPSSFVFTLTNTAPTLTAPTSGSRVTGMFTVNATSTGGGVSFLVDGTRKAFASAAPYSARLSGSSFGNGSHQLQVQQCDVTGKACSGPRSAIPIVNSSLGITLKSVSPSSFSPNGDKSRDTTTVTFSLPNTQSVEAFVFSASGARVRGPLHLGTLGGGTHTWTWTGGTNSNTRAADGRYTIWITGSRSTTSGAVPAGVLLDTQPPRFTSLSAPPVFYPIRDGYGDTFTLTGSATEAGRVQLVILNHSGAQIAVVAESKLAGAFSITWNGRDSSNHTVAPGSYSWYAVDSDSTGNRTWTSRHGFTGSSRRLVSKTTHVDLNGSDVFVDDSGSSGGCAQAGQITSTTVELSNCSTADIAVAAWRFTLPSEYKYVSVQLALTLTASSGPDDLAELMWDSDASLEEVAALAPPFVSGSARVVTFDAVPTGGRVLQNRVVEPMAVLDSSGLVDISHAQLILTYATLG